MRMFVLLGRRIQRRRGRRIHSIFIFQQRPGKRRAKLVCVPCWWILGPCRITDPTVCATKKKGKLGCIRSGPCRCERSRGFNIAVVTLLRGIGAVSSLKRTAFLFLREEFSG